MTTPNSPVPQPNTGTKKGAITVSVTQLSQPKVLQHMFVYMDRHMIYLIEFCFLIVYCFKYIMYPCLDNELID